MILNFWWLKEEHTSYKYIFDNSAHLMFAKYIISLLKWTLLASLSEGNNATFNKFKFIKLSRQYANRPYKNGNPLLECESPQTLYEKIIITFFKHFRPKVVSLSKK